MKMTEQDGWIETASGLARLSHNSKEGYDQAIGGIVEVVREKAIAGKPFAYLRFEVAQDCHMTLAEIANAFTQQDYPEMVKELVVAPAKMMEKFLAKVDQGSVLAAEAANQQGLTEKLIEAGLKPLTIENGQNPEHCVEPDLPGHCRENKRPHP